ncbi:hypothetical protein JST56_04110 [Candidatus Dependentiae bacterium]|nr:hypothetical protein [Candidatus Dependentiae bacterium]
MKKNFFSRLILPFVLLMHATTIFGMKNYEKPECDLCKKGFSNYNRKNNIDHLIKKHLQCPWCNAQPFSQKTKFLKHIEANHPDEKIYSCPNCLFITTRPYEVRRHMGLTHNRGTDKCFFDLKIFFNKVFPKTYSNYCFYCKQYFEKINAHFLEEHNMWLYGITEIMADASSNNMLKINPAHLKNHVQTQTENNTNTPEDNTLNFNEINDILDISNNLECPTCALICPNLYVYFAHLNECTGT